MKARPDASWSRLAAELGEYTSNLLPPKPSYLVVGHATRDVTPTGLRTGGTVSYASHAIAALGPEVRVLTSAAEIMEDEFEHASLAVVLAPETSTFQHVYDTGTRRQLLLKRAGDIHGSDVPEEWR